MILALLVAGSIFLDRNANGVRDPGEPGIAGVVVSNQVQAVRSDSGGRFQLDDAQGFGLIFVSVPDGYRSAGPFWKRTDSGQLDFPLVATAAPSAFTFIHASDTHLDSVSLPRMRMLQALVDSIRPDFVLLTGDLIRDALRVSDTVATFRYELYLKEQGKMSRPVWTAPGNHEIFGIERDKSHVSTDHPLYARKMYRHYLGPDYYSFNYGGVHFVALNSEDYDDQSYYGHIDSVQVEWLKRDLAFVPDSVPVVTFNHIPFFTAAEMINGYDEESVAPTIISVGGKKSFRHVVSNAGDLLKILRGHRYPLALGGHIHIRETLSYALGGQNTRFEQAAAVVGPSEADPLHFSSGITVYRVRNREISPGQFVPLPDPPEVGSAPAAWRDSSPHRVGFVTRSPQIKLHYLDWGGSGPPLVFIPGLGNTAHAFDDFAPRFTGRYRVIAFTRRGFGQSSHPDSGYDRATLTEDLKAVLDSLHLQRVFLVGHSIARVELTEFAVRYPGRVRGLVYLDAAYNMPGMDSVLQAVFPVFPELPSPPGPGAADTATAQAYVDFVHRTRGVAIPDADIRERFQYDGWNEDRLKSTRAVLNAFESPRYGAIRVPALSIYAQRDEPEQEEPWLRADTAAWDAIRKADFGEAVAMTWIAAEFRRLVAGSEAVVIHGGHHWVFVSHEAQVERLLTNFLRRHE